MWLDRQHEPPQYARRYGLEPRGHGYDERRRKMPDNIVVTDHASWFVGKLADTRTVAPL